MKRKVAAAASKKTATEKSQTILKNKINIKNISIATSEAAKPKTAKRKPRMAVAIIALLINVFIIPGLGTIIGGKLKHGLFQLFLLWLGGIILAFFGFALAVASPIAGLVIAMLGSLMVLTGWVWSIISGVFLVRDASA